MSDREQLVRALRGARRKALPAVRQLRLLFESLEAGDIGSARRLARSLRDSIPEAVAALELADHVLDGTQLRNGAKR